VKIAALALIVAACGKSPAPPAPPDAHPAPAPAPTPAAAPARELAARPLGPSLPTCEKAADHLAALVEDSALAPTPDQRAYIQHVLGRDRPTVVRYCVEVAVPKEIDCLLKAKEVADLFGCDRFRREIPPGLVEHTEASHEDCEHLFDRLRGFQVEQGTDPETLDKDREQVIRTCQEKAKVGTIACFIASPSYEQARHCP